MIFARKGQVGYTFLSERISRVIVNSTELHQVNASYKFKAECLEQLVESLSIRPSP
jgi:hypothetical protein